MNYLTTEDGKPINSTNPLTVSSVITGIADKDGNNVEISDSGEMKTVTTVTDADGHELAILANGKLPVDLTDLEALIGEVDDEPEENTLLARLKSLEDKIDAITAGTTPVVSQLSGSKVEQASAQDTQVATTAKTYTKAAGASQMEVYCETGYIRVRTDGEPCTSTTGEPIAAGFGSGWQADSISVYFIQESVITVVSR